MENLLEKCLGVYLFVTDPQCACVADAASDEQDTLDDLSRKLAVDLRTHIRRIEPHECFTPVRACGEPDAPASRAERCRATGSRSQEWLKLLEPLQHIASIAQMEGKLPSANEDSTLWEVRTRGR